MEFNLENIKKEIESRKNETILKEQTFGRTGGIPKTDKKRFLVDLLNSVNQGTATPAVQAIRAVSESTEAIHGLPTAAAKYQAPVNHNRQTSNDYVQPQQPQYQTSQAESREALFEQQMDRARDLISKKPIANPNNGLSQQLMEYTNAQYVGQGTAQPIVNEQYVGGGINVNALNEQIRKTMIDVLGGNTFDKMVEDTFKNVITEMYTRDKIENVINEFIDSGKFKKIVVETIIDIQNRKKNTK